jgi:predicted ATPase
LNGDVKEARYAFELKALKNYGFEVRQEQCRVTTTSDHWSWFERKGEGFKSSVDIRVRPSAEPTALVLPMIAGDPHFSPVHRALSTMKAYKIETAGIREMQDPDSGVSLRKDGSNAASVLRHIARTSKEDVERICEVLATIVPNTTQVSTAKHGNKLSLKFTQAWEEGKKLTFEAFSMSDGTLRALGLLLAVFQKPAPSLVAIEEPEATIHPGALGSVLDVLRHASKKMQVVVTTHSPEVLDAKWIEDRHVRVVEWHAGATRVAALSEATRGALRDHLMGAGELLRSNALDPEPLFEGGNAMSPGELFEVSRG